MHHVRQKHFQNKNDYKSDYLKLIEVQSFSYVNEMTKKMCLIPPRPTRFKPHCSYRNP